MAEKKYTTPDGDQIDKLSKKLDYGGDLPDREPEKMTSENFDDVTSDWSDTPNESENMKKSGKIYKALGHKTFFKRLLIGSIAFFVIAVLVAVFVFWGGFNRISAQKIDMEIRGLSAVAGGDEVVFDIFIKNKNNIALDDAELIVEYPPGTRNASDITEPLRRSKEQIGVIPSGGELERSIRMVLFGDKEDRKNINVTLEFKAKGSNATFSKNSVKEVTLSASPIVVTVKKPSEVSARETIDFEVEIKSNSQTPLRDLILVANYPFGFTLEDADPKPSSLNNVWHIGDIVPGEKKVIDISGNIDAPQNEERTFRFDVGPRAEGNIDQIDVPIVSVAETVAIKQPLVNATLQLNDSSDPEYSAQLGEKIRGTIYWKNNLPVDLNDMEIEVELAGGIHDRGSVSANGGFYRSSRNSIVWNKNNTSEFKSVRPDESGNVTFQFDILNDSSKVANDQLSLNLKISGIQFSEGSSPREVEYNVTSIVAVMSDIRLLPQALYFVGPFTNTGPIPPRAERDTTYTVRLPIANSLNRVTDVVVKGTLPEYVEWMGNLSPSGADISYDSSSRQFTWNVGVVEPSSSFKQASLQILFTPSLSQVDTAPILVKDIELTGRDATTGRSIRVQGNELNTRLSTDPNFTIGQERVKN